ncbi:MAG: SUMF1/EgtB/PvdO family nonheme iron enzyme [Planctomycetota bacterium]
MAARGKPFSFLAPLLFVGLAAGFVGLYFYRHTDPPPTVAAPDPRASQITASLAAADEAEKTGQWEIAKAALERAVALDPGNEILKGRLEEAVEESKRAVLVAEAGEARKQGNSAEEAAKLEEARRIREENELRGRQAAAQLNAMVQRAKALEKDGCVPLSIETWRQVSSAAEDRELKEYFAAHPSETVADADSDAIARKLASLLALLDDGEKSAVAQKAEGLAREGVAAKLESRMTTAIAKLKEAIGLDARDEWKKALEEAQAYVADSDKFLDAGLKAYEKQEWREAAENLELALSLNKECAAATKLLPVVKAAAVRKAMLAVPAATVLAGGAETKVKAFFIDPTEVSEAQYCAYLRAVHIPLPVRWRSAGKPDGDGSLPVMGVSAAEAAAYARWAGKRLPSEAEWLAAAGAGDGRAYPWGAEWDAAKANAKSQAPWACGAKPAGASPCGALDLAGNVAEWTSTVEDGKRVAKGGSFLFPESSCLLTWRWLEDDDLGFPGFGFRCAADGDEEK